MDYPSWLLWQRAGIKSVSLLSCNSVSMNIF